MRNCPHLAVDHNVAAFAELSFAVRWQGMLYTQRLKIKKNKALGAVANNSQSVTTDMQSTVPPLTSTTVFMLKVPIRA